MDPFPRSLALFFFIHVLPSHHAWDCTIICPPKKSSCLCFYAPGVDLTVQYRSSLALQFRYMKMESPTCKSKRDAPSHNDLYLIHLSALYLSTLCVKKKMKKEVLHCIIWMFSFKLDCINLYQFEF